MKYLKMGAKADNPGVINIFSNYPTINQNGSVMNELKISIETVWFQDESIFIRTASGDEWSMPMEWFPRLHNASPAERERFELSAFGIHWPELDEDLSFEGFFTYSKQRPV